MIGSLWPMINLLYRLKRHGETGGMSPNQKQAIHQSTCYMNVLSWTYHANKMHKWSPNRQVQAGSVSQMDLQQRITLDTRLHVAVGTTQHSNMTRGYRVTKRLQLASDLSSSPTQPAGPQEKSVCRSSFTRLLSCPHPRSFAGLLCKQSVSQS